MNTQYKNGGPAFPGKALVYKGLGMYDSEDVGGMSLRDWFAGQALAGMSAGSYWAENMRADSDAHVRAVADAAYASADAMLAAREKQP